MDLSRLSDDDLIALSNNNLGAMSDAGLKLLSAGDMPAPKKGFGAALGSGTESFIGALRTGAESIFSPEEAARKGLEREEARAGKYADQVGLDKLKEVYAKQGLTGAIGEVGRQIPLAILEQAPNIAATLGSAKLGATAGSVFGPVGTGIGAVGGALAPSALQLFGSNIQRQAAEQQATGQPLDISRSSAAGAAAIQAPLDVAATFIPLGGKIAGKFLGKEVEQLLMRGGTEAAEKLAKESFAKTLGKGVAVGAAAEIPTEITQQMLERYQAGLDLTSPDALKEYGEVAYQAGLLSPIGGAGRFVSKSGARDQVEAKKQEERLVAQEEARVLKEQEDMAEEARKLGEAQQETGQLFGEAAPTAEEVSVLPNRPELFPTGEVYTTGAPEDIGKPVLAARQTAPETLTVAERETEAESIKNIQREERSRLLKDLDKFEPQLLDIEKQRDAAAEAGNFKQFGKLDQQARELEKSIKFATDALKQRPAELSPEMEMAKLRGEQKNLIKQLQGMTGPSYDAKKAANVTTKLAEIETRIEEAAPAASQLDLFDEAKVGAESRELRAQQTEQRAQEQADLLQALKPEGKKEVLDEEAINRYQKGLQDLEDAYAEGADERIINRLVDELQRIGQEKEQATAKVAGVKTGAEQEQEVVRLERIRRAVTEEEAKLQQATTQEEVATIRADVAALKQRLTQAQLDRATGRPEKAKEFALEDQQEAFRNAVENVRTILSGEYFNSFSPDVASSLKSGIQTDIRKAGADYTEAALRELNAERQLAGTIQSAGKRIGGQAALTNDEALKVASAIKERFDFLAKDPTYLAEKVRDKNLPIFEQALERIKDQVRKGPSTLRKETPLLRQQFGKPKKEEAGKSAAEMGLTVREKEAGKKPDLSNINLAQKDLFAEKELEPVATVRATPQNFQRFVGIQANKFKQAKERAEAALAKIKEKADAAFKKQEEISKRANRLDREFVKQVEDQRSFVADLEKADQLISNLRFNAEQLWTYRSRAVKHIAEVKADIKKNGDALINVSVNTGKQTIKIRQNKSEYLKVKQRELKQFDDTAEENTRAIDSLHARANELANANIKTEKAILASMERRLASMEKPSPYAQQNKVYADKARAIVAEMEGTAENLLAKQIKEKRVAEQQAAKAMEALPSTKQEVVETLSKFKGSGETVLQKKVTVKETPKTETEKREQIIAKAKEGVAERIADKKAIEDRLEKGLSGDLANAKSNITFFENRLRTIEAQSTKDQETLVSLNKALANAKTADGKKQWQDKIDAVNRSIEAKQLGKTIDSLRSAIKALKEKGVSVERGMTFAAAQPPKTERKKSLKTGVKKVDVSKQGEEALSYIKKKTTDLEQEARDLGISRQDYEFVQNGLAFGFKAREETAPATTGNVSQADFEKELAKTKLPKGLKVVVFDRLGGALAEKVSASGRDPKKVRGGVLPDGTVIFVAENHTDLNDAKQTIAHELIGHLGVENLLGEAGMKALAKQIQKTDNSVFDLAEKLGVLDDVLAAYANARRTKSEEDSVLDAVRELIAHTEETTPTKSFLEKARDFIKALVGAVRASLRKRGLDLDISTSDIFKLLRDARKQFNEGSPGAYVNKDGDILFRTVPAVANAGFENALNYTKGIVAEQKSLKDRIFGEASGLIIETKYFDSIAPVTKALEPIKDSLKATQTMHYIRKHGQRMSITSEVATNGPMDIVAKKRKDGQTEYMLESQEGANMIQMAEALREADVGNIEATIRVFTLWMAAQRAKLPNVGLAKLNFGGKITQKMLDEVETSVKASPATKAAFEKASKIYAEYNKGLINFAVKTGALSKKLGDTLNKDANYVPFYRQSDKGEVLLDIGGAPPIKIGNLVDQPYLHELIGGDQPIFDIFTGAMQNTTMLTDMALRNMATKSVANTLGDLGLLKVGEKEKGKGIHPGDGPTGVNIIRFKSDGENYWAEVNSEAAGVPSELLVRGMEGVNTSLPQAVKLLNAPARVLRQMVTRNPAYVLRQLIRDPMTATMTAGLDVGPALGAFKQMAKMTMGADEGEILLRRRGTLGGQVLTGTAEDKVGILKSVLAGKKGWDYRMAQLDTLAIKADAATRVIMYNNFIKQGLSEMEADLATMEAMNFSKRGISPSLFMLSTMVPFMNAQMQGLSVLYKAFTGKMPFNEKLKVKQKLMQRGLMMMGFTMLYASMMQDDEAYQNANDDEKYGNWFVPNPFGEEHIKVPIPFEIGLLFKAIPEAVINTAFGDEKARDTMSAIGKMTWNSIPISGPQGIKPALEVAINHSFFTGREIESDRLQRFEPGERYTDRTSEVAKMVGGALNISPVKIEYLIKGYTGSLPLAVASLANPILRSSEAGEQPETRSFIGSETPLVGSFFQAKDASGLVNKAYKDMDEINKSKETYKKILDEGREQEAEAYMEANADMIAMGTMAGRFRKRMGDLTSQERLVRSDSSLSAGEKREMLDEIRKEKIDLAKSFSSARE
jgi:hypothetical protein